MSDSFGIQPVLVYVCYSTDIARMHAVLLQNINLLLKINIFIEITPKFYSLVYFGGRCN